MPFEAMRGCGYRKPGKMYLVGEGVAVPCDGLPLFLDPCETCGYFPEFYRGLDLIWKKYIEDLTYHHRSYEDCTCFPGCPICYPENNDLPRYGIMFASSRYYTPNEFIREASDQGISLAIGKIPKGLKLGKTWVVIAHNKVEDLEDPDYQLALGNYVNGQDKGLVNNALNPLVEPEIPRKAGIIYAFIPKRIEMPLWKKDASEEKIRELEEKGITPLIWDQDDPNALDHRELKDIIKDQD